MANYHFNTSYGHTGKSNAHASYILAEGKYRYKENEILFSDSKLPSWAETPNEFWEAVSINERLNGRGYREFRFSLPNELPVEENINLVNDFIKNTLNDSFYYTVAIHNKEVHTFEKSTQNIHCHLMFNERKIDGIERDEELFFKRANTKNPKLGGAKKSTEFNPKEKLLELRKDMEVLVNSYYEKNGMSERVSCESLGELQEKAEREGDLLNAERYERYAIHINGYLLKKDYEKMTETEKLNYDIHLEKIKARDLKEATYNHKMEELRQAEIEKALDINVSTLQTPTSLQTQNIFDEYISNEKSMVEIEKEICKNLDNLNDIELKTLFKLDRESYNIFRNKELLEKELFVMDSFENKNQMYFEKRAEIEEQIFKFDTALEISINEWKDKNLNKFENVKEELINEYKDNISSLKINKLNIETANKNLVKEFTNDDTMSNIKYLESKIEFNLKEYLSSMKDLKRLDFEINKIEKQLEKESLKNFVCNRMTNGELDKVVNQMNFIKKNIDTHDYNIKYGNEEKKNYSATLKSIDVKKYNELNDKLGSIYDSLDKEKYLKMRNSIEVKLKDKLLTLKDEKENYTNIVAIKKSNFISTDVSKEYFTNKVRDTKLDIKNLEEKTYVYNGMRNKVESFFSNERILHLATSKVCKGENIKLMREYEKTQNSLDSLKEKFENSGMFAKIGLKKEIKELENALDYLSDKHKDLMNSIKKEDLHIAIDSILKSQEKSLNAIDKLNSNNKQDIFALKTDLNNIIGVQKELYPYQNLESKQQIKQINFNKIMDNSKTGGGGQERIESFIDDLEKNKKNKDKDFSL